MANSHHVKLLMDHSVEAWNGWRHQGSNLEVRPDFAGAHLFDESARGADLHDADFTAAQMEHISFYGADLRRADFSNAFMRDVDFAGSNLNAANFDGAKLVGCDFRSANLVETNFSGVDLRGCDLRLAQIVRTNLTGASLDGCRVYGVAAWGAILDGASQSDLVITSESEPAITVDNLEVAQFIYLLLTNQKIRQVIDSITSKVVLILGRFTPERKAILGAIRDELRRQDYLPVLFDFDKPANRDITETVSTLAHMARFVIADLSDPKSIPHELAHVAPLLPSVPILPLIVRPQKEYAMFEHFFGFDTCSSLFATETKHTSWPRSK